VTVGIKAFTSDPGLGQGFTVQGSKVKNTRMKLGRLMNPSDQVNHLHSLGDAWKSARLMPIQLQKTCLPTLTVNL